MTFDGSSTATAACTQGVAPVKFSLRMLAEECAVKSQYDNGEAAEMLLRRLRVENAALYQEKSSAAMLAWARGEVEDATHRVRRQIASPQPSANALSSESLRDLAVSWLDWPVRPGIPLRDATKGTLQEASKVYLRDSTIYAARGAWFAAIAKALPNAKVKVRDVLDEKAVHKLAIACNVSGG